MTTPTHSDAAEKNPEVAAPTAAHAAVTPAPAENPYVCHAPRHLASAAASTASSTAATSANAPATMQAPQSAGDPVRLHAEEAAAVTQAAAAATTPATGANGEPLTIHITQNGPYKVDAGIALTQDTLTKDGDQLTYHTITTYDTGNKPYFLCRCGHSAHKPFCDGTHLHVTFKAAEVADASPYAMRALAYKGPVLTLLDDGRCAFARVCHRAGSEAWSLTASARRPAEVEEAVKASENCPTGRLTHVDNATGAVYEQAFAPSIVIIEDPAQKASGPYFVRGGVRLVGAKGTEYELRNRYALCRCGQSGNQPFCDATHCALHFQDASGAFVGQTGEADPSFNQ